MSGHARIQNTRSTSHHVDVIDQASVSVLVYAAPRMWRRPTQSRHPNTVIPSEGSRRLFLAFASRERVGFRSEESLFDPSANRDLHPTTKLSLRPSRTQRHRTRIPLHKLPLVPIRIHRRPIARLVQLRNLR